MTNNNVLKKYVKELNLHNKTQLTLTDQIQLRDLLFKNNELGLADYVVNLKSPNELEDLIVNILYK